jgi:hypothetical protein
MHSFFSWGMVIDWREQGRMTRMRRKFAVIHTRFYGGQAVLV